jgi:hypothetical protein
MPIEVRSVGYPGHVLHRRDATQGFKGAVFVVIGQPLGGDGLDLLEVGEQMCIEHFRAVRSVETLDKGVLIGLARLDVLNRDAFGRGPFGECLRD